MQANEIIKTLADRYPNHKHIVRSEFTRIKTTGQYHLDLDDTTRLCAEKCSWPNEWLLFAQTTDTQHEWKSINRDEFAPFIDKTLGGAIALLGRAVEAHQTKVLRKARQDATTESDRQAVARDFRMILPPAKLVGVDFSESKFEMSCTDHPTQKSTTKELSFSIVVDGITMSGYTTEYIEHETQQRERVLNIRFQTDEFWTDACRIDSYRVFSGEGQRVELSHGSGGNNRGFSSLQTLKARMRIFDLAILIVEHYAAVTGCTIG